MDALSDVTTDSHVATGNWTYVAERKSSAKTIKPQLLLSKHHQKHGLQTADAIKCKCNVNVNVNVDYIAHNRTAPSKSTVIYE